jgi:hypothetical protein
MHAPRNTVNAIRFTEQKSGDIKEVAAKISHYELIQESQGGLIPEDWKTGKHVQPGANRKSNGPRTETAFQRPNGLLPSPIFVHKKLRVRDSAKLHHLESFLETPSHRFLTYDVDTMLGNHPNQSMMRTDVGDYVHEIEFLVSKHCGSVRIHTGHTKPVCQSLRLPQIQVRYRDAMRLVTQFAPARELIPGPEAGPNCSKPQSVRSAHFTASRPRPGKRRLLTAREAGASSTARGARTDRPKSRTISFHSAWFYKDSWPFMRKTSSG